jgi:hypothetical protein
VGFTPGVTFGGAASTLGDILLRDHGDRFSRVLRYEQTFERSLYKALHELQRLQAARAGEDVPLPAVGELDVSVIVNGQEPDLPL